jgi:hypothetical protein
MKVIGTIDHLRRAVVPLMFPLAWACGAEPRPLESLPETSRLWMGLEEGSIRPAAYEQVRSPAGGYLKIHATHGETLEKGRHWATQDPEQLDLEARSLEMDRLRLDRKVKETRRTKEEANARLRLELHEAQRGRDDFIEASRSPELPEALRRRAAEAVANADARIAELTEMLDPAELERELQLEIDEGELQIERKRKQFQMLKRASEVTAGFSGELRLSESILRKIEDAPDPSQPIWIDGNELLATIIDDRSYEIIVTATSPLLAQIPREDLLVFFQEGRTGKLIEGAYVRTDEQDTGADITRNYVFSIQENSVEDARHSMGQRNLVHIYRKFPVKYRLVHKKDIAFLAPEVLESAGWSGLVARLWPGSRVVQVGPQTIAVEPANEN